MGDSPSSESDESLEVQERFDDQRTGKFGGDQTNLSDPSKAEGFKDAESETRYKLSMFPVFQPKSITSEERARSQDIARSMYDIDEQGFDPNIQSDGSSEQINVGPGDIFGLREKIAENLRQGGKASFDDQGNIIGATSYGPAFGGMGVLSGVLPNVTTYTGLNAGNPFGDPTMGGDDNNEPEIIRRRMSAETVPIEEETTPISDDLAVNYLQSPNFLYSGMGNLYQPYGYANNTLVDLLRTRNLTQPQQQAANLGLFANPGDFV
jgi:hypothetical protein